ncbi:DUF1465 family protein [Sphingomonas cavernae]|uniref:DUF1465 family protein n=1 Tax=Sphingomonas cavernae TaxID=2320861 RepID=A0A418WNS4_9SPHN|nr:DUF1465 family protein [Sphingomonas cavernae]RJF92881.1 DUF1465 family protein [Sphingomonas cavernae]
METQKAESRLTPRLVDALYVEAMLLADEARAYFDEHGKDDREQLAPMLRVGFSCESLKVTTRLMHVIAWLLTRRAVESGELNETQGRHPSRRLGHAVESDTTLVSQLPEDAQALIVSSIDLYDRVKRIDSGMEPTESPAHSLMRRLRASL